MSSDRIGISGQADENSRLVDEDGVEWFKFRCDYSFENARWSFDIWARNWPDAKARVAAICAGTEVHQNFDKDAPERGGSAFVTAEHTINSRPLPDAADFAEFQETNDVEALSNLRDWVQEALEAKGAVYTGGGIGFGACDLEIEIEGFRYTVSVTPVEN